MEFDKTVQSRWKVSLGCFVAGLTLFGLLRLTVAAWHGVEWVIGAVVCSFGVFFALLSLAAGEQRRVMAFLVLISVIVPFVPPNSPVICAFPLMLSYVLDYIDERRQKLSGSPTPRRD